jgi:hypothetical protein
LSFFPPPRLPLYPGRTRKNWIPRGDGLIAQASWFPDQHATPGLHGFDHTDKHHCRSLHTALCVNT